MMFSAATVKDSLTRDLMIGQVHNYAAASINNTVLCTYYDPTFGSVDNVIYNAAGVNSYVLGFSPDAVSNIACIQAHYWQRFFVASERVCCQYALL